MMMRASAAGICFRALAVGCTRKLCSLTLSLFCTAAVAHADVYDDCFQNDDPQLSLRACSEIISSGQHQGFFGAGETYLARGNAYYAMKEYRRALADYDESIRASPLFHDPYEARAKLFLDQEQYELAVLDADTAIELRPNYSNGYNLRAYIHLKWGRLSEALSDANMALQNAPDDAYSLDTRAHIYEAMGRRSDAISDFRRALELDPTLSESRQGLIRLGVL